MANEKYLVLKGCAGLGNRLMTICNAIEYCKNTNRKLVIDWSDGIFAEKGVNIFPRFFKINNFPGLASLDEVKNNIENLSFYPAVFKRNIESGGYDHFIHAYHPFFLKIPDSFLFNERLKMLRGFWLDRSKVLPTSAFDFFKEVFNLNNLPFGHDLSVERKEDVLVYFDFTPNELRNTFLKHISLQENIEKKVNAYAEDKKLGKNTVGVHVRSTDKQPKKTLDALFEKVKRLNLKDQQIFLATDSKLVSEHIKKAFSSVIEYPKLMPDIKEGGMHLWAKYNDQLEHGERMLEESIMDMWLLSKCEYLLYQGNSTFSQLSMFMHDDRTKAFAWDN